MLHDIEPTNRSGNRSFEDVLKARISRRNVLTKGALFSAAGFIGAVAGNRVFGQEAAASTTFDTAVSRSIGQTLLARGGSPAINFTPVTLADAAVSPEARIPLISPDYEYQVLIPWGTPLQPGGPEWDGDPNNRPTSGEQLQQVGVGHDGMWLFPIDSSNDHGVLCINHEFGSNNAVFGLERAAELNPFSGGDITQITSEEVLRSQYGHGCSVVEIKKIGGTWQPVASSKSRRITLNTPVEFSGPVAGTEYLENAAGNPAQGTVNNCGNGFTPWGTYLTCEENFNGYFGSNTPGYEPAEGSAEERYGFSKEGFGYGWYVQQPRFDLTNPAYTNERNRFGWMVEIDPMDPTKPPIKHTALGRFKHESGHFVTGRQGRAVVYMGDDQRFDYLYKFVGDGNWRNLIRRGINPLSQGTLFVAKFFESGRGEWMPLDYNRQGVLRQAFANQAEVLINTRKAADLLGATPMDRPEWITTIGTDVYCNLTNNSRRTEADGPNPLAPNPDGHIVKLETRNNHISWQFNWEVVAIAEDTHGTEDSFSDPDALYADPDGRIFIGTDGGQKDGLQDQLTVVDPTDIDPETGRIQTFKRLFMGVSGDEITGFAVTPDRKTMFINMQHPGNGNPTATNFPKLEQDDVTIPRDCTIVITKKDGGIIGS